jgi:flavin reductase (DIM6/NTAB) family NADH-FMN oxidoreductase RutF
MTTSTTTRSGAEAAAAPAAAAPAAATAIEPRDFRAAISLFATGVTDITTTTPDGPAGMTASAVCSLSLEPVQLLVCISTRLPTHTALERSGQFAVNVLGEGQRDLAMRFATPMEDKFAGVRLRQEDGLPVLRDAIAYFACDVSETIPGGDHTIFIGRVRECGHAPERRPLLYFGSQFGSLEDPESSLLRAWHDLPAAT